MSPDSTGMSAGTRAHSSRSPPAPAGPAGRSSGRGGSARYLKMKTVTMYPAGMASNELRPVIKLRSTAGTGYTYVTRKNRRNDPDRLLLRKYDPVARRHVTFREER